MKVLVAGSSGLIGRALSEKLVSRRHEAVRLKRTPGAEVIWAGPSGRDWRDELPQADAVINLSGEPIADKRWTKTQKKALIESRLRTTRAIVDAFTVSARRPKILINASAVGYYGPRGDEALTEDAGPGKGFLSDLCREWERQARKAESLGVRVVLLRTGIVLAKQGGALQKMLPPFRFFMGGPLGSGRQMMSWIHLEDEVNAILAALENESLKGPINLTAPHAATMRDFARTLGRVVKRPAAFPVPAPALQLLLGEMSEMLLTGQNAVPDRLLKSGFRFRFPDLEPALKDLVN